MRSIRVSNRQGKSELWRAALIVLILQETQPTSSNVGINWPNEVQIIPDSSNTITMPRADVELSIYGTIVTSSQQSHIIMSGDYVSILTTVQSCGSTMDMRSGAVFGLGMITLDQYQHATIPLSLATVAKYILCVCPDSSTQVIAGETICSDQAGLNTGIQVNLCIRLPGLS